MTRDEMRERLADWALKQHADGVREDGDTNDGEPVRRFALVREPPAAWCSRMVRAGLLLVGALIPGINVSAHDLYEMGSVRFLFTWLVDHGAVRLAPIAVAVGDLRFLLGRGSSDPLTGGSGIHHVGIAVEVFPDGVAHIVDGNWADRVSLNVEREDDPRSLWLRWPVN